MLKRIIWKEGAQLTFKLSDNLYTLGQMLKDPYMCFYKLSSSKPEVELEKENPLFIIPVARDFLQKRTIKKNNKPNPGKNVDLPRIWIRPKDNNKGGFPWLGGDLVEIDPELGDLGMDNKVLIYDLDKDAPELVKYELTNIWTDHALVSRLKLSLKEKKNIDPLKEMIFFGKDKYGLFS